MEDFRFDRQIARHSITRFVTRGAFGFIIVRRIRRTAMSAGATIHRHPYISITNRVGLVISQHTVGVIARYFNSFYRAFAMLTKFAYSLVTTIRFNATLVNGHFYVNVTWYYYFVNVWAKTSDRVNVGAINVLAPYRWYYENHGHRRWFDVLRIGRPLVGRVWVLYVGGLR